MQSIDNTNSTPSETLLWDKFREGDKAALSQIYTSNVQRLFQYGLALTSDRDLVKDCIHDLFVKLYNNRAMLSSTDNTFYYLSIALKNTIINVLNKNRNIDYLDVVEDTEDDDSESPESFFINKEENEKTSEMVEFILSKLTIRQREIIYYRYIEGKSIEEISLLTEMNSQSVSNVIQRSFNKIRFFFKKNSI